MPRISMTWPQYLRSECTFEGRCVALPRQEADVLLVLLLRRGHIVSIGELVEAIYEHPDDEPSKPEHHVAANLVQALREKLPGLVITDHGRGRLIPVE